MLCITCCKDKITSSVSATNCTAGVIHIEIPKQTQSLSSVISSIEILKLQDPDDNPIGMINKVEITKNKIFVQDAHKARALYVFNQSGEFVNTIGSVGQGEGEYIYLTDFTFDEDNNELIILDSGKNSLLFYNVKGVFLRKIDLDFIPRSLATLANDKIAIVKDRFSKNGMSEIVVIIDRKTRKIQSQFMSLPQYLTNFSLEACNQLFADNGYLYYLPSMSNVLYRLDEHKESRSVQLDFGKKWASESYLKEMSNQHPRSIMNRLNTDGYIYFLNIREATNNIYIDFHYRHKQYYAYHNSISKETIFFDVDEASFESFTPVGTTNNKFISAKIEEDNSSLIFFTFK